MDRQFLRTKLPTFGQRSEKGENWSLNFYKTRICNGRPNITFFMDIWADLQLAAYTGYLDFVVGSQKTTSLWCAPRLGTWMLWAGAKKLQVQKKFVLVL